MASLPTVFSQVKHCAWMENRNEVCGCRVAGRERLASDECEGEPFPLCWKHLEEIRAENLRYEKEVTAFVALRVPLTDSDLVGVRRLTLAHRREMDGPLLERYWVCRGGEDQFISIGDLHFQERTVISETLRAHGEFLQELADALALDGEFLRPFHTGTAGEAMKAIETMLEEIRATVPGPAYEQVDAIINRYYAGTSTQNRDKIRRRYLGLLNCAR